MRDNQATSGASACRCSFKFALYRPSRNQTPLRPTSASAASAASTAPVVAKPAPETPPLSPSVKRQITATPPPQIGGGGGAQPRALRFPDASPAPSAHHSRRPSRQQLVLLSPQLEALEASEPVSPLHGMIEEAVEESVLAPARVRPPVALRGFSHALWRQVCVCVDGGHCDVCVQWELAMLVHSGGTDPQNQLPEWQPDKSVSQL